MSSAMRRQGLVGEVKIQAEGDFLHARSAPILCAQA